MNPRKLIVKLAVSYTGKTLNRGGVLIEHNQDRIEIGHACNGSFYRREAIN